MLRPPDESPNPFLTRNVIRVVDSVGNQKRVVKQMDLTIAKSDEQPFLYMPTAKDTNALIRNSRIHVRIIGFCDCQASLRSVSNIIVSSSPSTPANCLKASVLSSWEVAGESMTVCRRDCSSLIRSNRVSMLSGSTLMWGGFWGKRPPLPSETLILML